MAADLNYVSPLTSDLTDYYTKQEVDELQQGDVDKFATQAQVIAGDNTVKGWVVSQDYLKEHQSLENYATKDYVNTVVSEIEVEGVTIEVVARLPQPQDASANTIYLVLSSASESGNIYDEWIYVPDAEDFELIGNTSSGIIPDLSDYATKTWVGEQGFLTEHQSLLGYATEAYVDSVVEALDIPDVSNFVEESELAAVAKSGSYDDLSNKPSIPIVPTNVSAFTNDAGYLTEHQSLANYATKSELNTKANANELSGLANLVSQKANAADLATVATSGSYNDLSDKPTIPSTSGLASETYVDNAIAAIDIPTVPTNVSEFTNDAGYLTAHQDISGKVDGTVVNGTTTAKIFNEADGGGAQIITASARGFAGVHDGSNPDATYATMYVKNAAGTSTLARVDLDGDGKAYYLKNGASKAAGSEIAVKSDIPDVSDFITANDLPDLTGYVESSDLAAVATSGDYDDLTNKPTIPSIAGLATEQYVTNAIDNATGDFVTLEDAEAYATKEDLATVATSGDYNDLINQPAIPSAPDLTPYATKAELATVATSGSYNDLTDKPTIPGNPTDATVGFTYQLYYQNIDSNATTIQDALTQLDGAIANNTIAIDAIDIPDVSNFVESSDLATVATSGDYDDLINKPTIPVLPTLATVATSGSYNDLTDKPSIPSGGITVQDVIDEFNANGLTLDDGTASKVEILNSDITATSYQGGTEQGIDWSVDTYSTTAPDNITFGKSVSENDTQTQGLSIGIHPDRNYETLEVDIVDVANNYNDTKTLAFQSDIPVGYELSENYNATNKALTLSVVASRA